MLKYSQNILPSVLCILCICVFVGKSACQQTTVSQVQDELASHANKLVELQTTMNNFTAVLSKLQIEMTSLQTENSQLKHQLTILTEMYNQCGCGNKTQASNTSTAQTQQGCPSNCHVTTTMQATDLTTMSLTTVPPSFNMTTLSQVSPVGTSKSQVMTAATKDTTSLQTTNTATAVTHGQGRTTTKAPNSFSNATLFSTNVTTSSPTTTNSDTSSSSSNMPTAVKTDTTSPTSTYRENTTTTSVTAQPATQTTIANTETVTTTATQTGIVTLNKTTITKQTTKSTAQTPSEKTTQTTTAPTPAVTKTTIPSTSTTTSQAQPITSISMANTSSTEITTTAWTTMQPTETTTQTTTTTTMSTTTQKPFLDSCQEALESGISRTVAKLHIASSGKVIHAMCERSDGQEWLVIQRRETGDVNFNRGWNDYKIGFGNVGLVGDFWLGNENIYQITDSSDYRLKIELEDWDGNTVFAEYDHFRLEPESSKYRLNVANFRGTAGDSFHYRQSFMLQHHMMKFSTPDRDYDYSFMNCAQELGSGWWFNDCYSSNLNGQYLNSPYGRRTMGESSGQPTLEGTGIEWYPYKQKQYSFKRVQMKISNTQTAFIG